MRFLSVGSVSWFNQRVCYHSHCQVLGEKVLQVSVSGSILGSLTHSLSQTSKAHIKSSACFQNLLYMKTIGPELTILSL